MMDVETQKELMRVAIKPALRMLVASVATLETEIRRDFATVLGSAGADSTPGDSEEIAETLYELLHPRIVTRR